MRTTLRYMTWPFIVTALGLILAAFLGYEFSGTASGALSFFLIAAVLAVLKSRCRSTMPSSMPTS